MLSSAISALSDRLDSRFLLAFWLPAFVLVLGGFGIVTVWVGSSSMEHWAASLVLLPTRCLVMGYPRGHATPALCATAD
jgi:hypothetical protein